MIKLFKVKSFAYTPFEDPKDLDYLRRNGVVVTYDIRQADIILAQNLKHLRRLFLQYFFSKKFLIWTFEPRFNTSFVSWRWIIPGIVKCHYMNIYTGDVFTSITTFHAHKINQKLNRVEDRQEINNRKIVALMSFFGGTSTPPLLRDGKNIDLIALRTKLALEGHKQGKIEIIGRGWPTGISKEDSRSGDWPARKREIIKNYSFNLCFENTVASNYVTEKIWDSIESYSLPIYYGEGTNIYSVFPKNSFIDYSDFKEPQELFEFIRNLSAHEYANRMNRCIEVYNSISSKGDEHVWLERKKSLDKIIEKCRAI